MVNGRDSASLKLLGKSYHLLLNLLPRIKLLVSKPNWPLLGIHLVAASFIILAARLAVLLPYGEMLVAFEENGMDGVERFARATPGFYWGGLIMDLLIYAPSMGLLISFVLSLAANLRYRQPWTNALISTTFTFMVYSFGMIDFVSSYIVFDILGRSQFRVALVITIFWFCASALLLYFGKWTKRYLRFVPRDEYLAFERASTAEPYRIRDVRCRKCYTMNLESDSVCSSCGKRL